MHCDDDSRFERKVTEVEIDPDEIVVIYHGNCNDGFCAAWVAHQLFGDSAAYVPANHGAEPPDVRGKTVFLLDFTYKRATIEKLIAQAKRVIVLDHHQTAKEDLQGLDTKYPEKCWIKFDMDKSGGRLTWDFCFPDTPSPWLVDYTEDRDLWRHSLAHTKEINAAISSYPYDFKVWDLLSKLPTLSDLIQEGVGIERYRARLIEKAVDNAIPTRIGGYEVLAVNATAEFSEVAGSLAKDRPFGAAWFIRRDGKKQWSLRSTPQGVDVAKVAEKFGGGGHKHAAGFQE